MTSDRAGSWGTAAILLEYDEGQHLLLHVHRLQDCQAFMLFRNPLWQHGGTLVCVTPEALLRLAMFDQLQTCSDPFGAIGICSTAEMHACPEAVIQLGRAHISLEDLQPCTKQILLQDQLLLTLSESPCRVLGRA